MSTTGIMEDIRELLKQGNTSGEVIAMGYKPPSVYKAQRQLRKGTDRTDQPATQVVVTNMASEGWSELREENSKLRHQVSLLEELAVERDALQEELELARCSNEDLQTRASQVQQLRDRLAALEPEALVAEKLRQEVKELNHQVSHGKAAMAQETGHWKGRFQQEEKSRQDAEALAAKRSSDIDGLKAENQRLSQEMQEMPGRFTAQVWEMLQPFKQELEELRLLKVWIGHPCTACGKPTPGVTTREVAGQILQEGGYGHGHCLKKRSWW